MRPPKLYLMEFDKSEHWLRERAEKQAERAQKQFLARGGKWEDPKSPLWKWFVTSSLYPSYRLQHEMGRKDVALQAIADHIQHDLPLPRWAAEGFVLALQKIKSYEVGSWDDVFGKRLRKGQHLAAMRKKYRIAPKVRQHIAKLRQDGKPVDFEEVGKTFNVGATLAKVYYRDSYLSLDGRKKRRKSPSRAKVGNSEISRPDF